MSKKLKLIVVPYLVKLLMQCIALTCRVTWENRAFYDQQNEANQAYLISLWHNCSTIAGWAMRRSRATVMISESKDGEYVAQLAKLFGINSVRGSSSGRGLGAVRECKSLLSNGHPIAITPDGPRGPRYSIQPGLLWLAALNEVPIIPLHIESSRQWVLKSWDQHRFPKPFARINVVFGDPIHLKKGDLEQDFKAVAKNVQTKMMDNMDQARQFAR